MSKHSLFCLLTLSVFSCFYSTLFSQTPEWIHIPVVGPTGDITSSGNRVWVTSDRSISELDSSGNFVRHWTEFNSGMPASNPHQMATDSAGNLWVGLWGSLARLSGTTWTSWSSATSPMGAGLVSGIDVAPDGKVWMASSDGIRSFDGTVWAFYPDSLIPGKTTPGFFSIDADLDGDIWFTCSAGLYRLSGSTFTRWFTANSPLPVNACTHLLVTRSGMVWVKSLSSLFAFDGDTTWVEHNMGNGLPCKEITDLAEGAGGTIYASTWQSSSACSEYGVMYFDGATWQYDHESNSALDMNGAFAVWVDEHNRTWAGGVAEHELYRKTDSVWTRKNYLYHNIDLTDVNAVIEAVGRDVYVTNDSLLMIDSTLTPTLRWTYGTCDDLSWDKEDGIWVNSYFPSSGNLVHYTGAGTETVHLIHPGIICPEATNDGSVWYWPTMPPGSYYTRYNFKDSVYITVNELNSPLDSIYFLDIFAQDSNHIWFPSTDGLYELNPYPDSIWTYHSGLGLDLVYGFVVDNAGRLVVRNSDYLSLYNGLSWSQYVSVSAFPALGSMRDLAVTPDNKIWMPGYTRTLFWNGSALDSLMFFGHQVGASSCTVDAAGNLWLAGEDGIFIYREGGVDLDLGVLTAAPQPVETPARFTLYPNPATDAVRIRLEGEATGNSLIRLLDMQGRVLAELEVKDGREEGWLPLHHFAQGLYMVQVLINGVSHSALLIHD